PQLLIPQGADQFVNADRCVESGAAIRLLPDDVNPETVRRGIDVLLSDDSYAQAAGRLRAEIGSMPSPADWIGPLHALAEAAAR
ncbi:MAG: hypothetical protein QOD72_1956, partial [Acidimicrobiaceae bacterium]|nr:hypothetical protein [Acidimicrobiaceae bacterium]